jgi:hypothetical protein
MSSLVFAAEPMELSNAQMDGVTAGGIAFSDAIATAIGRTAATLTGASALAAVQVTISFELTTIRGVGTQSLAASSSSAL